MGLAVSVIGSVVAVSLCAPPSAASEIRKKRQKEGAGERSRRKEQEEEEQEQQQWQWEQEEEQQQSLGESLENQNKIANRIENFISIFMAFGN